MPPHKSHRSEGFHPAPEACSGPKDLGGSEAQTHVGTEEPDRPSHEGLGRTRRDEARRQLPRTAGVQSKLPWDGSESERGCSGAAGTLGVTHGDRD